MQQNERGVTFMALVAAFTGTLGIFFANFFLVYTLKLLASGRVPVGKYALVTLGLLLTASPFYWLYRRYRANRRMVDLPPSAEIERGVPGFSERDVQLVLGFIERQGRLSLEDVQALTGLNAAQGQALLASLEPLPKAKSTLTEVPIANADGENPFDIDFSR